MGIFERFLDVNLPSECYLSSAKLYKLVYEKEANDQYGGETIELTTHITNEIHDWIQRICCAPLTGDGKLPDVCIIELGGLVGDTEVVTYLEAFRQFQNLVKHKNFCCIHITWLPKPSVTNEHKTKLTQVSVENLLKSGLTPDIIICRSETEVSDDVRAKVAKYSPVAIDQVVNVPILPSLYHLPGYLKEHHVYDFLCSRLNITVPPPRQRQLLPLWDKLAIVANEVSKPVTVALVGKYTNFARSYLSLREALEHAALACNHKLNLVCIYAEDLEAETKSNHPDVFHKAWTSICNVDGILVPGGRGPRGLEGKIAAIHWARCYRKPFLGIGIGFHCAVIEYARYVLNMKEANTAEVEEDEHKQVVIAVPDQNSLQVDGMKIGKKASVFYGQKSLSKVLYNNKSTILERHCHLYDVNPCYVDELQKAGMRFVARDGHGKRVDILELDNLPYFVAVQFHPEFSSRPLKPSPPILGFIMACIGKLDALTKKEFLPPYKCEDLASSIDDDEECEEDVMSFGDIDSMFSINSLTKDVN